MPRLIPILVCLLALPLLADGPLTNDDVITMVRAGISADVIMEKIKTSSTAFTTTTPALVQLAASKVPDAVIQLMVASTTATAPAAAPVAETVAPMGRTVLEGVEFWARNAGYRGDLVIDERGLTFCCGQDLQVNNRYFRCTMSFQVPLATITSAIVMTDPGKMPGVHILDAAGQGYYFVTDNLGHDQRDRILAAFPQALQALFTRKPAITHEEHSWREQKTIMRTYTPAAVTSGNVCNPDYELMPWGRQ